jgi:hypothetical protein
LQNGKVSSFSATFAAADASNTHAAGEKKHAIAQRFACFSPASRVLLGRKSLVAGKIIPSALSYQAYKLLIMN